MKDNEKTPKLNKENKLTDDMLEKVTGGDEYNLEGLKLKPIEEGEISVLPQVTQIIKPWPETNK